MKQFAVLGLGSFGASLARNLHELGHDVFAIDKNEDVINGIADDVTFAVQADITDIHVLKSIGIQKCRCSDRGAFRRFKCFFFRSDQRKRTWDTKCVCERLKTIYRQKFFINLVLIR